MPTLECSTSNIISTDSPSSMCRTCKSAGGGHSKGCEFKHFSELTGAGEGCRQS